MTAYQQFIKDFTKTRESFIAGNNKIIKKVSKERDFDLRTLTVKDDPYFKNRKALYYR